MSMNSPFESPPSIAGAIVAVALATVALLLANFTGTLPAHLSSVRLSAADAVFSALLAVCWLCIASWTHPYDGRAEWFAAIVRVFQRSVPVSALICGLHH